MIKKLSLIFVGVSLCFILIGCSKQENDENSINKAIIQEDPSAKQELENSDSNNVLGEELALNKLDDEVDIDLTALSSTLVYAEVYNMMMSPETYIGQTIKMKGKYYSLYYEETGKYYHYVIIEDAAACCQQGLEFIWNGEHIFPDDYPSDGTQVEVIGVFDTYEELGEIYPYVATDEIKVIK